MLALLAILRKIKDLLVICWSLRVTCWSPKEHYFYFVIMKDLRSNRSPKGNMWLAISVALLCMVVNQNERKLGSSP